MEGMFNKFDLIRAAGNLARAWAIWRVTDSSASDVESSRPRAGAKLALRRACVQAREAIARHDLGAAVIAIERGRRIDPDDVRVVELRAVLSLIEDRAEEAVHDLERTNVTAPRLRLLLALARCQAGQAARARLDLHEWTAEERCPAAARVLMAWLDLEAHDPEGAHETLLRDEAVIPDICICQTMILMEMGGELSSRARQAAGILLHAYSHHPSVGWWLASLGLVEQANQTSAPIEMIGQLADDLARRPRVIDTLLLAQRLSPQAGRIELLRRALARVLGRLDDPLSALRALTELAMMAGDFDEARRWVRRGLGVHPYDANLALLLDQLSSDGETQGEDGKEPDPKEDESTQALRRAVEHHPGWPDMRRALILRFHRLGRKREAAAAARQWLDDQPDSRAARQIIKEVAA